MSRPQQAPPKRPETVTYLAACPCGFPNAVWAGVVDAANGGGTRYELECSHCGIEGRSSVGCRVAGGAQNSPRRRNKPDPGDVHLTNASTASVGSRQDSPHRQSSSTSSERPESSMNETA